MSGASSRAPDLTGPIRLVTPEATGTSPGWWVLLGVGGALLVFAGVVGFAWWRRRRRDVRDSGFGVLCRAARLDHGAQELVRALASRIGAEPVALMLSRCAFRRAALQSAPSMSKRARARVGELERRLHPDMGAGIGRGGGNSGAKAGERGLLA